LGARYEYLFESMTLKRTAFPESYIEGDLDLHVHFGLGAGSGEGDTRNYCAVLKSSDGSLVGDPKLGVPGVSDAVSGFLEGLTSELVFPMFIPVRKVGQHGEYRNLGVLSHVVRLQPLDKCDIVVVDALDLSVPASERVFSFFGAGVEAGVERTLREDGEGGTTRRFAVVPDDQLPGEMIQGGPTIVNDISNDGAPFGGRLFSDLSPQDVLIALRVAFVDDFIRIAPQEPIKGFLKSLEVVLDTP
jgi:hypothetical protein